MGNGFKLQLPLCRYGTPAIPLTRLCCWWAISTVRDTKDSTAVPSTPRSSFFAYHHGVCAARIRIRHPVLDIYIHRRTILKTTRVTRLCLLSSQLIWKPATMHHTCETRTAVDFVTDPTGIASQLSPRIFRSTPPQFSPPPATPSPGTYTMSRVDEVETWLTWYLPHGQLRVSRPPHQLGVAPPVLLGTGALLAE